MKPSLNHIEKFRIRSGLLGSNASYGRNGAFRIKAPDYLEGKSVFIIIASDQMGWEHVSVSILGEDRTPTWNEMCMIKDLFWDAEETVIQIHPPRSMYVDMHPYCLHMWRPIGNEIPLPPPMMVGIIKEKHGHGQQD